MTYTIVFRGGGMIMVVFLCGFLLKRGKYHEQFD